MRWHLRMGCWIYAAVVLGAWLFWAYPEQFDVLRWKATVVAFGVFLGFYAWRSLHPTLRIHQEEDRWFRVMWSAIRAFFVAAITLAFAFTV